jgi:hypothetical protein
LKIKDYSEPDNGDARNEPPKPAPLYRLSLKRRSSTLLLLRGKPQCSRLGLLLANIKVKEEQLLCQLFRPAGIQYAFHPQLGGNKGFFRSSGPAFRAPGALTPALDGWSAADAKGSRSPFRGELSFIYKTLWRHGQNLNRPPLLTIDQKINRLISRFSASVQRVSQEMMLAPLDAELERQHGRGA